MKIGIIGAGIHGLSSAKILRQPGHNAFQRGFGVAA